MFISMLEKLSLFRLAGQITFDAINVKMSGSVLEENHLLRCWGSLSLVTWIQALK